MLSYRHAFHAGNHADVLKHLVLVQLVAYMAQKDKPFWYIDTHAGAGAYALDSAYAQKLAEFREGVGRLWQRKDLPAVVKAYVDEVRRFNGEGGLRRYPGSPLVAAQTLREQDRMRLFELHPSDSRSLKSTFADAGKRVVVDASDGFVGLKALLPPASRRALTLIDPPYEEKRDYERVIVAMRDALERFATGVYCVWYPQLARREAQELPDRLKKLGAKSWLHATLRVTAPSADGFGMHGSGLFIVNPPWTLQATLAEVLPYLAEVLATGDGAGYTLEQEAA
ncbi:23S rRNA (adenine(2030)-N(6))-methyltransferase RlmJ [Rhodocyclus purpureus]|uniref:23S rRNA (adenine(2030)-N(6))-methyltransferase RlmJ n=1 Tax=Rhodocyclus purpureus TaxID=1067 RepID=UPI001912E2EF|nr:23S rRNA (adenine(2030)-N(6))-methyltransferase RlmJ [Rhodocyclus purpureus]MBK5913577.1 23S rRNA (adenine(2030)-N(6))-methyltransferase RlmJ [Rhodocyclus purpureus]